MDDTLGTEDNVLSVRSDDRGHYLQGAIYECVIGGTDET